MPSPLPPELPRVHDEDWVMQPLGELALKYDTVENHGWYDNLEPTVADLDAALPEGSVLVDYSGGTGILADRLLKRVGERGIGIVIADASPKFLRLALEKLRDDERVAFRLIRYDKAASRLVLLDELLEEPLRSHGVDAIASTNAIHLYYDLVPTLASWTRVLKPGAPCFVQSGNIANPAAAPDEHVIDDTVESIDAAAKRLVRDDARWSAFRPALDDAARLSAHEAVRRKFFLPVRPLAEYRRAFADAGLLVEEVTARRIEARVSEWRQFLAAYHEGVLGWAGGSERVDGTAPSDEVVAQRLELLGAAMAEAFAGSETFPCCWTYIRARSRA
jgi:ubiquinone/menaquinone biosynthesis C-methylase UbiE